MKLWRNHFSISYGNRTKEQLGYTVHCGPWVTCNIFGFYFCVQSAEYNPICLQGTVENFINRLEELLKDDVMNWYKTNLQQSSPKCRRLTCNSCWGCETDLRYAEAQLESVQVIEDLAAFTMPLKCSFVEIYKWFLKFLWKLRILRSYCLPGIICVDYNPPGR